MEPMVISDATITCTGVFILAIDVGAVFCQEMEDRPLSLFNCIRRETQQTTPVSGVDITG